MNRKSLLSQSGVTFLLFITVMILTGTLLLVGKVSVNQQNNQRQSSTIKKLYTAQDALLGFALGQATPGLLPCPDVTGDGDANNVTGGCLQSKGWLPFRTLGIDDLRDDAGEKLWYVIDPDYSVGAIPFNSSSASRLNQAGAPLAFAILAPQQSLNGQQRATTFTDASNYLEGANGDADPFTVDYRNDSDHNDQLLAYSTADFWALIENSTVLPAASAALTQYVADCGVYPWAATFAANPLDSVVGAQQGSLPSQSSIASDGSSCASALSLPTWLENHWALALQYQFCLSSEGQCLNITGDETNLATAVLIAPGTPLTGQDRTTRDLNDYFENENSSTSTIIEKRNPSSHSLSFNDVVTFLP